MAWRQAARWLAIWDSRCVALFRDGEFDSRRQHKAGIWLVKRLVQFVQFVWFCGQQICGTPEAGLVTLRTLAVRLANGLAVDVVNQLCSHSSETDAHTLEMKRRHPPLANASVKLRTAGLLALDAIELLATAHGAHGFEIAVAAGDGGADIAIGSIDRRRLLQNELGSRG